MKRRGFLKRISLILASVAGVITSGAILSQIIPGGIKKNKRIKVGKLSDFPVDTYTLLEEQKIFIYRDHESIQAISAVCTHLGCLVNKSDDGFECPCHGSVYRSDGSVIKGPAPRALSWYRMDKAPDGNMIVDLDVVCDAEEKLIIG